MSDAVQLEARLFDRVEKLERQNRWMRATLTGMLVVVAGAVLLAAKTSDADKTLEATRIILRDEDGNKRIVLGQEQLPNQESSRTGVFVYDATGKACASLGHMGLTVEENGMHRLSLGIGKDKYAGLLILAEPGKKEGQILLFYTDDGKPIFGMNDENGKTRIMMGLDTKRAEKPFFLLQDANQKSFFAQTQQ